ncbi:tRNA (adenosine(37)-N6)-dimethylallyltransferase MiaA [Paludibacterium yongneupense]|uniref:tRNA (adenosine(37)-N6)-dimethylallyltransferase MiaA n=1 Tax=Paludibacterium yongneupense TaxID=400061 RepID=UPI00048EB3BB|nr:tRNA (adenosine(37)-N6)-dimethylallyltransferase MiaA [Paludibacterium yongneupense]
MPTPPRVILLMGPTASGKTGLALEIARRFPCEIVSVDSALVYRGMDIGTAKPSAAEQALCPHHLIDIIDPPDAYSAAQFHADANRLIATINARGKHALLVGGTMMYFKALRDGLSALPQADAGLRAEIDREAAILGWPALHARLAALDPVTAARLEPNDAQRIQRALEVCLLAAAPMSQLLERGREQAAVFDALSLALVPAERSWLHARIAERFSQMLEQGFLDEVARLRERWPTLSLQLPSMRCVGYRQAWEFQDGDYDHATFVGKGIAATRQLAKRQLTWIRGMDTLTLAAEAPDMTSAALSAVASHIEGRPLPDTLAYRGAY